MAELWRSEQTHALGLHPSCCGLLHMVGAEDAVHTQGRAKPARPLQRRSYRIPVDGGWSLFNILLMSN